MNPLAIGLGSCEPAWTLGDAPGRLLLRPGAHISPHISHFPLAPAGKRAQSESGRPSAMFSIRSERVSRPWSASAEVDPLSARIRAGCLRSGTAPWVSSLCDGPVTAWRLRSPAVEPHSCWGSRFYRVVVPVQADPRRPHMTSIALQAEEISAASATHLPADLAQVFADEQRGWRERGEPSG